MLSFGSQPSVEREVFSRFSVREEYIGSSGWQFLVERTDDFKLRFKDLYFSLRELGFWAFARKQQGLVLISIVKATPHKERNPWIYVGLLAVTLASVAVSGYELSIAYFMALGVKASLASVAATTVEFVISLLAILGIHEMGHKFVTEKSGERASWPYFIPGPPYLLGAGFLGIGTFGAVIMAEEPPLNRDHLFDLGISGPMAGFIASVVAAAIGVALSPPLAMPSALQSLGQDYAIFYRVPLLIQIFFALKGQSPYYSALNPVLIASWIGMLVTFLNLLPAAQLDGGHIFRSFLTQRQMMALSVAVAMLMFLIGYWLMALLVLLMAFFPDPGALEEVTPLSKGRKSSLLLILAVIILTAIVI
ncbi:site-2 protease family protein [Tardisphaera miroshnichenkoae]